MRFPPDIEGDFTFPQFYQVRMQPDESGLADIAATAAETIDQVLAAGPIRAGDTVAVAVGSRGLANLPALIGVFCQRLKHVGARPFIVPAMGSHGGATAAGQTALLARLGVSEETCGVPIRASMEAVPVATAFEDVPVFLAKEILRADHAVCLNRIKPHTKFKGPLESGLAKMLCVGMGKHEGALAYHRYALRHGFFPLLEAMARAILAHSNFRFGVAVIENAQDETCHIEAVPAEQLLEREPTLLSIAKDHFPRLPFQRLDVLAIETIGKEISGAGMDPNVTGRAFDLMESDFSEAMQATRVAVLNLSPRTGGNALGLGNADVITDKVFRAMDYETTLMNALTSLSLHKAFIPVRMPDDRKALQTCFATLGPLPPETIRAVVIRDTAHLGYFLASTALMAAPEHHRRTEIVKGPFALKFDGTFNLKTPWQET